MNTTQRNCLTAAAAITAAGFFVALAYGQLITAFTFFVIIILIFLSDS